MTYLSLFSGACGGDLGLQHLLGLRCAGYVEIDPYCQKLIRQRIAHGPTPAQAILRQAIQDRTRMVLALDTTRILACEEA